MEECPVCKSAEEDHIVLPDAKIVSENKITHVADSCRICRSCGVSFFVGIRNVESEKKD